MAYNLRIKFLKPSLSFYHFTCILGTMWMIIHTLKFFGSSVEVISLLSLSNVVDVGNRPR